MNIKPGDLFEWVYMFNNASVQIGEELYSYPMGKYVPCSGLCLCVGINADIIHWVSDQGLFRADEPARGIFRIEQLVIPRKVEQ